MTETVIVLPLWFVILAALAILPTALYNAFAILAWLVVWTKQDLNTYKTKEDR